jgi:hypothetical protein
VISGLCVIGVLLVAALPAPLVRALDFENPEA